MVFGRNGTDGARTGRGPRRRGPRESFAWWEYAIMVAVGVLILGGAVVLIRAIASSESSEEPAPSSAPSLECSSSSWFDSTTGTCVPKTVCEDGDVYDDATNTCAAPPPDVRSVDPRNGPQEGVTELTITGTGFVDGATVTIDDLPAIGTSVVDDTTITARTPPSEVTFAVDIQVTNPDGQADVLDNVFTYDEPQIEYVTEIVPRTGSTLGGEAVIIKGRDFSDGALVSFYGRPATDVVVLNPKTIRAIIPPAPEGPTVVNVRNPGEEPYTLQDGFRYVDQPPRRVDRVRPREGAEAGGTKVTVVGSGFRRGATLTIGGKKARNVRIVNSTRITAVTPPGNVGRVNVAVRNPDVPAAILTRGFSYVEAPTITGMTPAELPETGKKRIVITGTGFLPGAKVTLDGAPATRVKVVSPTRITARAPAGKPGPAILVVANPGQPVARLPKAVTYVEVKEKPKPKPKPSATPAPTPPPTPAALPACRPLNAGSIGTSIGTDLILTDADLFPGSLRSPRLTGATFQSTSGANAGSITWKSSPPRITWSPPSGGPATGLVTFAYQASNCSGTGTGSKVTVFSD